MVGVAKRTGTQSSAKQSQMKFSEGECREKEKGGQ